MVSEATRTVEKQIKLYYESQLKKARGSASNHNGSTPAGPSAHGSSPMTLDQVMGGDGVAN